MSKISLSKLQNRGRREVSIDIDGEQVQVGFAPGRVTPKLYREMQAGAGDELEKVAQFVAGVVTDWSLTEDEEGQIPLPVTAEAMQDVPLEFLAMVAAEITKALSPNSESAESGAAG